MPEDNYNKRELDTYFSRITSQLDRIETQVRKTNGRTTKNEQNISTVNTKINTAIWAFGITLPIILGLGIFIFNGQLKSVEAIISKSVSEEIESYQFEVIQ